MKDTTWIKLAMAGDSTPLSAEEEKALFARIADGDMSASDELVLRTRRFVLSLVMDFKDCPVEGLDLFNEGMIGLIEAMKSFDAALGFRFTTYAKCHVINHICNYISDNTNGISIPANVKKQLAAINDFVYQYTTVNGKEPSVETIAEAMGKDPKAIKRYLNDYNIHTVSLDQPSYDDEDYALIDRIPSYDETDSSDIDLYEAIDELSENEKAVTRLHYGFTDDQVAVSFEEISRRLGLSLDKVRMIHSSAKHKLRLRLGSR